MLPKLKSDHARGEAHGSSFFFEQESTGGARPPVYIRDRRDLIKCAQDIRDEARERVLAIFVDDALKVLKQKIVSIGTESGSTVDFRLIIAIAYAVRARGLFLAHNHPSGDARPSTLDLSVTRQLNHATEACNLTFIAHAIVARHDEYVIDLHSGAEYWSETAHP